MSTLMTCEPAVTIAGLNESKFVTTPHGYKPGASGLTPVCRPTPIVRFIPMSEQSSKQLMHCMARLTRRYRFYPWPFTMEPVRYSVGYVQKNRFIVAHLFNSVKQTPPPMRLQRTRHSSLRMNARAFWLGLVIIAGMVMRIVVRVSGLREYEPCFLFGSGFAISFSLI